MPRGTWAPLSEPRAFGLRDSHPLWWAFPGPSAKREVCDSPAGRQPCPNGPTTPGAQRLPAITRARFRLLPVRSPLLGQSLLFSSRPATKMFQFAGCPLAALCVQAGVSQMTVTGYPIRRPPDQSSFAAPRGVSSRATSFLGPLPQGIHRAPLLA